MLSAVGDFLSGSPSKCSKEEKYIASIDQGTSSSRFMVFDRKGNVVASHQREHTQHYPKPGMVEHDAEEIWNSVKICIRKTMNDNNLDSNNIAALGITNQRETSLVWNKHTGKPYHRAIVWNDTRTLDICEKLSSNNKDIEKMIKEKTGLPLSPYFSGTKLMYLLDTIPNLRKDAEIGDAIFGTIDTWLVWKLTNGHSHVTDVTNASRTLLMNINTRKWDTGMLKLLNIPIAMLPNICSSSEHYGFIENDNENSVGGINELIGVDITGILGDQQAALFGQTCFNQGETKVTYGTGAFLMMNIGSNVKLSNHGLITTVAYQLGPDAEPCYALEGSVAYCGSLIQWLRDNLNFIKDAADSEKLALSVNDNGGVYFVPAFAGLFAPYWRTEARGIITGLTAYNTAAHITRAALEAAAFQTNEIIDSMIADSEIQLPILKVDGGMTKNSTLMQFQSDLLSTPLVCPTMAETTALGSAYAAGLAIGYYTNLNELSKNYKSNKKWIPNMKIDYRNNLLRNWRKAVARSLNWTEPEPEIKQSENESEGNEMQIETKNKRNNIVNANNQLISQLSSLSCVNDFNDSKVGTTIVSSGYWTGVYHTITVSVITGILTYKYLPKITDMFCKRK
jgi:glycerol kinase